MTDPALTWETTLSLLARRAKATTWFLCGDRKPHCWSGPLTPAERIKEMAQFIAAKKPDGATALWWP